MSNKFENAYALLIGISQYEKDDKLIFIPKAKEEINTLRSLLVHPSFGGYRPGKVLTLIDEEATKENIEKAFKWAKRKLNKNESEDKKLFVYISGQEYLPENATTGLFDSL